MGPPCSRSTGGELVLSNDRRPTRRVVNRAALFSLERRGVMELDMRFLPAADHSLASLPHCVSALPAVPLHFAPLASLR